MRNPYHVIRSASACTSVAPCHTETTVDTPSCDVDYREDWRTGSLFTLRVPVDSCSPVRAPRCVDSYVSEVEHAQEKAALIWHTQTLLTRRYSDGFRATYQRKSAEAYANARRLMGLPE